MKGFYMIANACKSKQSQKHALRRQRSHVRIVSGAPVKSKTWTCVRAKALYLVQRAPAERRPGRPTLSALTHPLITEWQLIAAPGKRSCPPERFPAKACPEG